jgi:hypothetical protein
MSDGKIQSGGKKREPETTAAFRLPEPAVDHVTAVLPPTSPKLLDAIRAKLSSCNVTVNSSGFYIDERSDGSGGKRYRSLPNRLEGAWAIEYDGTRFVVAKSQKSWLLIYTTPMEKLYEDPRLMGVNLKHRDILKTPENATLYVSHVSRADLDTLSGVAASLKQKEKKRKEEPSTMIPSPSNYLGREEMKAKLKSAKYVTSSDIMFDIDEFADSIKFCIPNLNDAGNPHYILQAGEEETEYRLFVGLETAIPEGYSKYAQFRVINTETKEWCVLFRES